MLGESTPRGYTVLDAQWTFVRPVLTSPAAVLQSPSVNSAAAGSSCLGVAGASTSDGAQVVVKQGCDAAAHDTLWRINPDGFMVNIDGKCVGSSGTMSRPAGDAVITEVS